MITFIGQLLTDDRGLHCYTQRVCKDLNLLILCHEVLRWVNVEVHWYTKLAFLNFRHSIY